MSRWANQDRFNDELKTASRHFGIPVNILKALVAIESGFDPDAYLAEQGGDGSRGLMQIRLSTAQGEGYHGSADNLSLPAVNVYYGTSYLSRLLSTVPQVRTPQGQLVPDYLGAVSAYNGGYRPERGFGARVTVETKNCLRKDPTTGQCVKWFVAHPGEFGNQPYIDRFRDALRYFGGEKDLSAARGAGVALGIALLGFLGLKATGVL